MKAIIFNRLTDWIPLRRPNRGGWDLIPTVTSGADQNESGGRVALPGQPLTNVKGVRQGANRAGFPQIRRHGEDTRHLRDEADQATHRRNARDPHRGCVNNHAVRAASAGAAIDIGGLTYGSPDLRCRTPRPADASGYRCLRAASSIWTFAQMGRQSFSNINLFQ